MNHDLRFGLLSLFAMGAVVSGTILVGQGCSSTPTAVADDAGPFEGGSDAGPVCTNCVEQQCISLWAGCLLDSSCRAIHMCALGANSPNNKTACVCSAKEVDGGLDPELTYRMFAACNDTRTCGAKCADTCSSTCANGAPNTVLGACAASDAGTSDAGDAGDAGDASAEAGSDAADAGDGGDASTPAPPAPPTMEACVTCMTAQCQDSIKACVLGTDCAKYLACVNGCTSNACADACLATHETGKAVGDEMMRCGHARCATACGF